jgi:hypothetical protein
MNNEKVKLIVLTTLTEVAHTPQEKNELLNRMDFIRSEMAWRCSRRREFLLGMILCLTGGILVSVLSLNANVSPVQSEHRVASSSSPEKPWWEFLFEKPTKK